jgi:hypothetical protein
MMTPKNVETHVGTNIRSQLTVKAKIICYCNFFSHILAAAMGLEPLTLR